MLIMRHSIEHFFMASRNQTWGSKYFQNSNFCFYILCLQTFSYRVYCSWMGKYMRSTSLKCKINFIILFSFFKAHYSNSNQILEFFSSYRKIYCDFCGNIHWKIPYWWKQFINSADFYHNSLFWQLDD